MCGAVVAAVALNGCSGTTQRAAPRCDEDPACLEIVGDLVLPSAEWSNGGRLLLPSRFADFRLYGFPEVRLPAGRADRCEGLGFLIVQWGEQTDITEFDDGSYLAGAEVQGLVVRLDGAEQPSDLDQQSAYWQFRVGQDRVWLDKDAAAAGEEIPTGWPPPGTVVRLTGAADPSRCDIAPPDTSVA